MTLNLALNYDKIFRAVSLSKKCFYYNIGPWMAMTTPKKATMGTKLATKTTRPHLFVVILLTFFSGSTSIITTTMMMMMMIVFSLSSEGRTKKINYVEIDRRIFLNARAHWALDAVARLYKTRMRRRESFHSDGAWRREGGRGWASKKYNSQIPRASVRQR